MKNALAPHFLKIFLPLNLLALFALYQFAMHFNAVNLALVICGWLMIGGYGIAIGHHRLFSHRSFKTYSWIEKVLAYFGLLAGQGSGLFWVAVHRGSHHPYADTEKDMHSPVHGKFHSYLGWQMRLDPAKVSFKKCGPMLSDSWHVFLHKNYVKIFWGSILLASLINWRIGLFMVVIPSFISMHTENCVDLFCHTKGLGYRNYSTEDNSTNIWWLGYFGFGQGWHNNHHYAQNAACYSKKWWELDLTRPMIFIIKAR
jgi:stearoyl-CoA desaturase (delta-9 desaturase)